MEIIKPKVLVDICGTLFDSNTTFDFLDYSIVNRNYILYRRITKTFVWRLLNKTLLVTLGYDLSRTVAIRFLKGKNKMELDQLMETFYTEKLSTIKHQAVWDKIDDLKSNGNELILVSATLDFIATKIALKNGFKKVLSSKLSFENGICNGVISSDLLGRKIEFLEKEKICSPYNIVITDNFSDLNLIKASREAIIVCTNKKHRHWISVLQKNDYHNYEFILV